MYLVYVARDEQGEVLYVGQTGNLNRRLRQHTTTRSPWMRRLSRLDVLPAGTRTQALEIESRMLSNLCPPFNTNGGTAARRDIGETAEAILGVLAGGEHLTTAEISQRLGQRGLATWLHRLHRRDGVVKPIAWVAGGRGRATWALASDPLPAACECCATDAYVALDGAPARVKRTRRKQVSRARRHLEQHLKRQDARIRLLISPVAPSDAARWLAIPQFAEVVEACEALAAAS